MKKKMMHKWCVSMHIDAPNHLVLENRAEKNSSCRSIRATAAWLHACVWPKWAAVALIGSPPLKRAQLVGPPKCANLNTKEGLDF